MPCETLVVIEGTALKLAIGVDRTDTDRFHVTKEFLAQLLGTNRPTVSVMVSEFEKAGILKVEGRRVTLEDRNRLTKAACECYEIIRKNYEQVGREIRISKSAPIRRATPR